MQPLAAKATIVIQPFMGSSVCWGKASEMVVSSFAKHAGVDAVTRM
jgi:hypothetical protein